MPKILHISISSSIGGGPEHIYQLISGLQEDFECHVACPDNGPYFDKFKVLTQGRITRMPFRKFKPVYLRSLFKYIRVNGIDIVHAHGKGAGIYARILRLFLDTPVIHTPHGINQNIEKGLPGKGYIMFERFFKHLISDIIYVSKTELEYAKKLKVWDDVEEHVIYNGTKLFSEEEVREFRKEKREEMRWLNETVLITASRFDFQKNTIDFCKIALQLPEYDFIVLGDGIEMSACKDFCKLNRITNVLFIGEVADPLKYFAAADVYISTARWEGLSMAILEAMSVGLPVVASNVVGNIDLIDEGTNGFLYQHNSLDQAIDQIKMILDSTNYLNFSLGSKRIHEKMFSSTSMCNQTALVYLNAIEKKQTFK